MSDTKWRKLFAALDAHPELGLRQCVYKFVGNAEERTGSSVVGLDPPHPWVDASSFGPIPLRSIEWLLFPRVAEYRADRTTPARHEPQDVDGAWRILAGLGQLPLEMTESGLLVRGYLPAAR
jgi:hypothetical protein